MSRLPTRRSTETRTRCASWSGSCSKTRIGTRARRSTFACSSSPAGRASPSSTTVPASRLPSASAASSASTARTVPAPGRTPALACRSPSGSQNSTRAASRPAPAARAAPRSSSTFRSYRLLKLAPHASGMFDISPDHAIGIYAALLVLPLALLALKVRRSRHVPGTVLGASVLMAMSGAIHLGLVWTHLEESFTAALFVMNGVAYLVLSQLYTWRWWRLLSAGLISATLLGYLVYIVLG